MSLQIKHPESYQVPENISSNIFRAYDIRGITTKGLAPDVVYGIGLSIGTYAMCSDHKKIFVAQDVRLSSPLLCKALCTGLLQTGIDVIDIGIVPTPILYFATCVSQTNSGIMVTGSHNPGHYNGLKIVLGGKNLTPPEIQGLYTRMLSKDFIKGQGTYTQQSITERYITRIQKDIAISRHFKIVIDAGNGVTGIIAPTLYRALGCEVTELFCTPDGHFPNHHPDPSVALNLKTLQATVKSQGADLGLAFDGDGDRLGVITQAGTLILPDRQLMLFAQDVLSRVPGAPILFDVKCTKNLIEVIKEAGGEPCMWKTGHSLIKSRMHKIDAPLAGEMSGHIFFGERWYGFDDGLYTGARLLEILSRHPHHSSESLFQTFPDSCNTPEIQIPLPDHKKQPFITQFLAESDFPGARITTIDGLRADFKNGWGLVRASNTTPCLTLRFEADNPRQLSNIQAAFKTQLLKTDPDLAIPF